MDCNNCKYLNITESEQRRRAKEGEHIPHKCNFYNKKLIHGVRGNRFHNPRIQPCEECKPTSVEIRLFNHKNGKVLYENLNMEQLEHILKVLDPKGWQ